MSRKKRLPQSTDEKNTTLRNQDNQCDGGSSRVGGTNIENLAAVDASENLIHVHFPAGNVHDVKETRKYKKIKPQSEMALLVEKAHGECELRNCIVNRNANFCILAKAINPIRSISTPLQGIPFGKRILPETKVTPLRCNPL